ncbi:MAG: peptidoglycan editing factor PgeF [Minicystis sp.]
MEKSASAITSALLDRAGFRHAFFTRRGGASRPPWDTLSFALSVGDDPAAVRENFARAARILGVPPERVYVLSQVHGTASRVLTGAEIFDEVVRSVGDITLSRATDVACGVRSADCVPVLLADTATGAVAAIHSGWRGTVSNVAAAGVAALRDLIGGKGELIAAIGPHIQACCFEVGDDVAAQLAGASTLGEAAVILAEGKKPHVDLRKIVREQLAAEGIAGDAIDDVMGCSVCEPALFHSYRRDGAVSGRMLSAIIAR